MLAPDFRLDGRVALLTGAGRGIGLGIAHALASAGCAVAIQDIDLDVASAEADKINSAGGKAIALAGDINDLSLPQRAVAEVVSRLGSLSVLVNNASIQSGGDWKRFSIDTIEQEIRADLVSPILFCKEAVPHMRSAGYGRILNIGSVQQRRGNPWMLPYSLSKAAMEKMTTAIAQDLARDRIPVNLIAPGWINTYRNRDDFPTPETTAEKGQKHIPLGRVGEPSDFGGIALLLCSPAGSYITGQSIYVNGGIGLR